MKSGFSDSSRWLGRWGIESLALIFLFAAWLPLLRYGQLPERIPIHYNFRGEADGWGERSFVWFFPLMAVVLYLVLSAVQHCPRYANFPVKVTEANRKALYGQAAGMCRWLKAECCALFAYGAYQAGQSALNPWILWGWIGLIAITTGVYWIRMKFI